jgi:hypothetical protein
VTSISLSKKTLAPDSKKAPLWSARPFQFVSLLDMLTFNAPDFFNYAQDFRGLQITIEKMLHSHESDEPIEDELRQVWQGDTDNMIRLCKEMDLDLSVMLLEQIKEDLSSRIFTYDNFANLLKELSRRVKDEMTRNLYLVIPRRNVEYYQKQNPFGDDVANNFQSASYDISEAGKCFAIDRDTASVLHLMRVLEIGLHALAKALNVPFQHSNWNTIIEQIEAEIRNIDKSLNKPPTWRDDRKFYSAAANQFRFFKDSWRNYAMHAHDKYTPEEALIIYTSVKAFMGHIATKLKE